MTIARKVRVLTTARTVSKDAGSPGAGACSDCGVGATLTGYYGGAISDRIGRKVVVRLANYWMAGSATLFIFCRSSAEVLVAAVLFGLGYGAYISVDWALGTDVLPNRDEAGKDMAVWHVSMVLPQTLAAAPAAMLIDSFGHRVMLEGGQPVMHYHSGGYVMLFAVAAVLLAIAASLLRRIKGST